jgi:hypothetical protein
MILFYVGTALASLCVRLARVPVRPCVVSKLSIEPRRLFKFSSHRQKLCNCWTNIFMSSSTTSSSNFQLILNSLTEYANKTEIDLTSNPFAHKLQSCHSAEAISELLQDRAKAFREYRDGNRKLINCLLPIVQLLHTFSGILGETLVPVSPFE